MPTPKHYTEDIARMKADLKKANIAAGARYETIPNWQANPYGAGAAKEKEFKFTDMPTTEHSYRGHTLIPSPVEPYYWTIRAEGFQTHLKLEGQFTDVPSCERAIDAYWKQEELKQEGSLA